MRGLPAVQLPPAGPPCRAQVVTVAGRLPGARMVATTAGLKQRGARMVPGAGEAVLADCTGTLGMTPRTPHPRPVRPPGGAFAQPLDMDAASRPHPVGGGGGGTEMRVGGGRVGPLFVDSGGDGGYVVPYTAEDGSLSYWPLPPGGPAAPPATVQDVDVHDLADLDSGAVVAYSMDVDAGVLRVWQQQQINRPHYNRPPGTVYGLPTTPTQLLVTDEYPTSAQAYDPVTNYVKNTGEDPYATVPIDVDEDAGYDLGPYRVRGFARGVSRLTGRFTVSAPQEVSVREYSLSTRQQVGTLPSLPTSGSLGVRTFMFRFRLPGGGYVETSEGVAVRTGFWDEERQDYVLATTRMLFRFGGRLWEVQTMVSQFFGAGVGATYTNFWESEPGKRRAPDGTWAGGVYWAEPFTTLFIPDGRTAVEFAPFEMPAPPALRATVAGRVLTVEGGEVGALDQPGHAVHGNDRPVVTWGGAVLPCSSWAVLRARVPARPGGRAEVVEDVLLTVEGAQLCAYRAGGVRSAVPAAQVLPGAGHVLCAHYLPAEGRELGEPSSLTWGSDRAMLTARVGAGWRAVRLAGFDPWRDLTVAQWQAQGVGRPRRLAEYAAARGRPGPLPAWPLGVAAVEATRPCWTERGQVWRWPGESAATPDVRVGRVYPWLGAEHLGEDARNDERDAGVVARGEPGGVDDGLLRFQLVSGGQAHVMVARVAVGAGVTEPPALDMVGVGAPAARAWCGPPVLGPGRVRYRVAVWEWRQAAQAGDVLRVQRAGVRVSLAWLWSFAPPSGGGDAS